MSVLCFCSALPTALDLSQAVPGCLLSQAFISFSLFSAPRAAALVLSPGCSGVSALMSMCQFSLFSALLLQRWFFHQAVPECLLS
jgi:hypothetical protein